MILNNGSHPIYVVKYHKWIYNKYFLNIEDSACVRKAVLFRATNRQSSPSLAAGRSALLSAARERSYGVRLDSYRIYFIRALLGGRRLCSITGQS